MIESCNSKHLTLVNKIGDKTEFTITRVHCTLTEATEGLNEKIYTQLQLK